MGILSSNLKIQNSMNELKYLQLKLLYYKNRSVAKVYKSKKQDLIQNLFIKHKMPGGMPGGFFEQQEITDEYRNLLNQMKGHINSKLGANHSSFKIDKVFTQIVAGTYYHFHLTADNGDKLSALVFQPLPHTNEALKLESVHQGHTEARNPN